MATLRFKKKEKPMLRLTPKPVKNGHHSFRVAKAEALKKRT